MITLLVEAGGDAAERLARTLHAMIPAVVDGVLRDAFIINLDGSGTIDRIAEAAGAGSLPVSDLHNAFAQARADWLMCVEPGARLSGDWVDVLSEMLAGADRRAATPMRFRAEPVGLSIRRLFVRPRALRCGLIIHKTQAISAKSGSLEGLARGRATRRIAARIIPADN